MKETILDKYALQKLTKEDNVWLKKMLEQDPSFQQELDFHADVVNGMAHYSNNKEREKTLKDKISQIDAALEQEGFFGDNLEKNLIKSLQRKGENELQDTISAIDQNLEEEGFFKTAPQQKPVFGFVKLFLAAASILLILTFSWSFFKSADFNPEQQYALAFQPYKNTLSTAVQLELSEQGFGGNPKELPLNQLLEAMTAYDQQNYPKACELLKKADNGELDKSYQNTVRLYLALSYMANSQKQQAIPILEKLAQEVSTKQQETVTWYLGLAYLNDGTLEQSKEYLEQLVASKKYGEQASLLIKQF